MKLAVQNHFYHFLYLAVSPVGHLYDRQVAIEIDLGLRSLEQAALEIG